MAGKPRILFVCTGNICRSPTAEGVLRHLAQKMEITVYVESAGTGDWHVGQAPDERAQRHATSRGYDLSAQRARVVRPGDFDAFDQILAMDRGQRLLLEGQDVPDPWSRPPAWAC
jgi:protein-tyrosine phosphatase